jgi:hypothetical protein
VSIFVDASNPDNHLPLQWLRAREPYAHPLMLPADHPDPYQEAGCHPELVEWFWHRLAAKLPDQARCLIYGTPTLVQPISGVVLGVGMGTQCCLRVHPDDLTAAAKLQCTPVHDWSSSGDVTDLRKELGPHWVFVACENEARHWLARSYEFQSRRPQPTAALITEATPRAERKRRRRGS